MARHHSRSPSPVSSSKRARRDDPRASDRYERERDRPSGSSRRRADDDREDLDRRERERRRSRSRERDRRDGDRHRDRDRDRERDRKESTRDRSDRDRRDRDRDRDSRGGGSTRDRSRERDRDVPRRSRSPARSDGRATRTASPAAASAAKSNGVAHSANGSPAPPSAPASAKASDPAAETEEEKKLRLKRERLEAWKAKKAAEAAAKPPAPAAASAPPPQSAAPASPPSTSSKPVAARLGLPIASSSSPLPTKPLAAAKTALKAPTAVGLPKKPSFNAFGLPASSKTGARATAAGMFGDDEEEQKVLYKPEEGAEIESGLEPDKPTQAQLDEIAKREEELAKQAKGEADETGGMDVDGDANAQETKANGKHESDDDDDELADGGPVVKAAPMSEAARIAAREEQEANELEARLRASKADATKMDEDGADAAEEEDEDPLDAFMKDVSTQVKKVDKADLSRLGSPSTSDAPNGKQKGENGKANGKKSKLNQVEVMGEDSGSEDEDGRRDLDMDEMDKTSLRAEDILALAQKKLKKRDLANVDHSKITYDSFRKAFYHPPPEIAEMTNEEAEALRVELDNIKIRGVDCPKPITRWSHCGLPAVCLEVIRSLGYPKPTSIQSQAIPAIMSGRDVIGVAKTGSGKTVAFLLPMFRHIKDQRPLDSMEGPIAMIMTPTRELATQIAKEAKPFLKALGLRVTCAYGGSPLKDNIADMKRGAEVIVCTPGRMIELLITNSGRIINLRRVTYLVLDEADRMFDMGFEPQVMKILGQIRPDRQTVLFSATFPKQMEALARKILRKPLEITVGGRSVVAAEIEQIVEVREEESKFNRLLEILGRTYNDDAEARTLIFVHRQDSADNLLRDLLSKNYACMSLHGGKDQVDRDATIQDFKAGIIPIVIATSVAARGLDVKLLKLVINYDCPNHMEDYVHRAGRTGRAGNKGTCITFITPEQDRYAGDLKKALEASNATVPDDLIKLCEVFIDKVKAGKATAASSGFGGKGLEKFEKERQEKDRAERSAYGEEEGAKAEGDEKEGEEKKKPDGAAAAGGSSSAAAVSAAAKHLDIPDDEIIIRRGSAQDSNRKAHSGPRMNEQNLAALKAAEAAAKQAGLDASGISKAQSVIAKLTASIQAKKQAQFGRPEDANSSAPSSSDYNSHGGTSQEYSAVIPINDYPQKARWKITNKETMQTLTETTGASITNKGIFYEKGKEPAADGEPKLHLLVESSEEFKVRHAITEIKRYLLEASTAALEAESRDPGRGPGRYNVLGQH